MAISLRVHPHGGAKADGDGDPDGVAVARSQVEPAAFADLYRRYVDPIYRYCYRVLGTKETAEDVTSVVFANALAALPTYRAEGPSFRAWLFAIAHNTIVDELRARRPTAELDAAFAIADPAPLPEERAVLEDANRSVRVLLTQLPPEQARVVELRLSGLTGPEVARALNRSPNTVKVAQHRAYTRLRALLRDRSAREEVGDDAS